MRALLRQRKHKDNTKCKYGIIFTLLFQSNLEHLLSKTLVSHMTNEISYTSQPYSKQPGALSWANGSGYPRLQLDSLKVNISYASKQQLERSATQKKTNYVVSDCLHELRSNNKAKMASLNCCLSQSGLIRHWDLFSTNIQLCGTSGVGLIVQLNRKKKKKKKLKGKTISCWITSSLKHYKPFSVGW